MAWTVRKSNDDGFGIVGLLDDYNELCRLSVRMDRNIIQVLEKALQVGIDVLSDRDVILGD